MYNDTRPGNNDKTTIFTRGALKTYSEQCYVFNQISTSKAIELRNKGQHDVKLTDVAVSDIVGNRVRTKFANYFANFDKFINFVNDCSSWEST